MPDFRVPAATLAAIQVLGECWRGDWSDFDGRLLRAQLDDLTLIARREAEGQGVEEALAAFYAGADICTGCMAWGSNCVCAR